MNSDPNNILPLMMLIIGILGVATVLSENQRGHQNLMRVPVDDRGEGTMNNETTNSESVKNENGCKLDMDHVDRAWCSEPCKRRVLDIVLESHPCKQSFKRTDVVPLYEAGPLRHYRVTLWVKDWSEDQPREVIWKTFHVILEGLERHLVSVTEDRKSRLPLTLKGLHFKEELQNTHA